MSSDKKEPESSTHSKEVPKNAAAELVKEYCEELDLVLLLAGLLCGFSGGFVLYAYPQLQVDNTGEIVDLLRVILYTLDNTTFGSDIPAVPEWAGTPRTAVVTLILLYISLGLTTTSIMVAIFAKEALYLYALAVVPKLDAWEGQGQNPCLRQFIKVCRFNVIVLYGLLLFALLLFDCGLALQAWTVNYAISSLLIFGGFLVTLVFPIFLLLALADLGFLNLTRWMEKCSWLLPEEGR